MLIRLILSLANLNISRTLSLMNVIYEWNKLDPDIRSFASCSLFRNTLSKFIRSTHRKTFNINDSVGVKLFTFVNISLDMVLETLNRLCPGSTEAETTTHYFLRYHFYNANRSALMNELNEIDSSFSTLNENKFIDLILYGSDKFDDKKNRNILMCTIKFPIHKVLKDLTRTCSNFFLVLMWSEYVYYLYVYLRIIIFSFFLLLFGFPPTEILYPVGYCCMFLISVFIFV